jgi:hypothetical protein
MDSRAGAGPPMRSLGRRDPYLQISVAVMLPIGRFPLPSEMDSCPVNMPLIMLLERLVAYHRGAAAERAQVTALEELDYSGYRKCQMADELFSGVSVDAAIESGIHQSQSDDRGACCYKGLHDGDHCCIILTAHLFRFILFAR